MAFSLACIVLGNDLLQKELQEKEGFQYSDVLYLLHSKDKVGLWHPSECSRRGNGSKKTQSVTTKHSPRQHASNLFKRIYFVGHEFVIIWFQIFHSCHMSSVMCTVLMRGKISVLNQTLRLIACPSNPPSCSSYPENTKASEMSRGEDSFPKAANMRQLFFFKKKKNLPTMSYFSSWWKWDAS